MRLRSAVPASLLVAFAAAAAPGVAGAAPHHNRGLTIAAIPKTIIAGDPVLIYGRLNADPVAGQTIILYHHVSGGSPGYSKVSETKTTNGGIYTFPRADGVVETNRNWFVREAGLHGVHSRTIYEHVSALVTLAASPVTADTNHSVLFSGHVTPSHAGERVLLQQQEGVNGNDFRTIASARLGFGAKYAIHYRFRVPGARELRVVLRDDQRNITSVSETVSVSIQQTQVRSFTINSSSPITDYNTPVTISGTLYQRPATAAPAPEPNTSVTLYGHFAHQGYRALGSTVTSADGSYRFTQSPTQNETYVVTSTLPPKRHTAQLRQGVRDVVTLMASPASSTGSTAGKPVTFTGTVTPDKAGHLIYLQRLGLDGDWHTVAETRVSTSSSYEFLRLVFTTGMFRTRIDGGPTNLGGHSPSVTVSGEVPSVSTLPTAS